MPSTSSSSSLLVGAVALLLSSSSLSVTEAGSINDIEHVVLFMQENRAFDHYYGNIRGVRGFNDRAAPPLPNGASPFYQPIALANGTVGYQLPWHVDSTRTSASCMDAPCMSYLCDIAIWNHGQYDSWNTARDAGMGMSFFNRADLPYYYALIDGFTVGDQYFQATFTETNPNRLHFFSGSNGLSVGQSPVLDNTEPADGFTWTTVAEVLEAANVTWKLYQEVDNFDDNGFAWFANFKNAPAGSPLRTKGLGIVSDLETAFAADLAAGTLPQVSWIVAPTALSEHATNHPAAGEDLSARLIAQLKAHPDMYAKTAFIINYDEGGQFFDHHWTPTPPVSSDDGVSSVRVDQELNGGVAPIGLGFRVPLIVVSPWTRGGYVVSQTLSHTSIIQFLEKRFSVHVPTISDWRRAIEGDLTAAFDFGSFDVSWPDLPSTVGYVNQSNTECNTLPMPQPPTTQTVPTQEPGVRPARVLPLTFDVEFAVAVNAKTAAGTLTIAALDAAGAAFQLYDLAQLASTNPRKYAVGSGSHITDILAFNTTLGSYSFSLHGPNGFVRQWSGSAAVSSNPCDSIDVVKVLEDKANARLQIQFAATTAAPSKQSCVFTIADNAYKVGGPFSVTVPSGTTTPVPAFVPLGSGNWYDYTVSSATTPSFKRRLLGRVERPGATSDPAMQLHPAVTSMRHELAPATMDVDVLIPPPLFDCMQHNTVHHANERIIRASDAGHHAAVKDMLQQARVNKDASRCLFGQAEDECAAMLIDAVANANVEQQLP